jgi:hypothetical protein
LPLPEEVVLHPAAKNWAVVLIYLWNSLHHIGSRIQGPFTIYGVRSTWLSQARSFNKEIVEQYGTNFNENDLRMSRKDILIKKQNLEFETISKLNMLYEISNYNFLITPNKGKYS